MPTFLCLTIHSSRIPCITSITPSSPMTPQWLWRTSPWITHSPARTMPTTWWTRLPLTKGTSSSGSVSHPVLITMPHSCRILSCPQGGHCPCEERELRLIWKPIVPQLLLCKCSLPLTPSPLPYKGFSWRAGKNREAAPDFYLSWSTLPAWNR